MYIANVALIINIGLNHNKRTLKQPIVNRFFKTRISSARNLNSLLIKNSSKALTFINFIYENNSFAYFVLSSLAFINYFYSFQVTLPMIKFNIDVKTITPNPAKKDIPI